jgi:site-specific recombinase XerC
MAHQRGRRTRIAPNIFEDAIGIAGIARAGGLPQRELRFPPGTSIAKVTKALEAMRVRMRAEAAQRRVVLRAGTLGGDVAAYLETLPAARRKVRAAELAPWVAAVGHRRRADLKVADLRTVMASWLDAPKPPAPNTIRLRRRALAQMWDALDGEDAPNPARRLRAPRDRKPVVRAWPMDALDRVIARVKAPKKRARLWMLLWTALPASGLKQLPMRDVDLDAGHITYPARVKGGGAPAVTLPMFFPRTREVAQAWLRAFAWGPFDTRELNRRLKAAARMERRANPASPIDPARLRVHDLRHSALTAIARATNNPYVVKAYGQHVDLETSLRYCQEALPDMVRDAARAAMGAAMDLPSASGREGPRLAVAPSPRTRRIRPKS